MTEASKNQNGTSIDLEAKTLEELVALRQAIDARISKIKTEAAGALRLSVEREADRLGISVREVLGAGRRRRSPSATTSTQSEDQ